MLILHNHRVKFHLHFHVFYFQKSRSFYEKLVEIVALQHIIVNFSVKNCEKQYMIEFDFESSIL